MPYHRIVSSSNFHYNFNLIINVILVLCEIKFNLVEINDIYIWPREQIEKIGLLRCSMCLPAQTQ